ncbi:MAG: AraC family transcriptional regulator [Chloroflexia bacterium]|nr:AraC family transcriptional regulator [Chloroflexia bacterium]
MKPGDILPQTAPERFFADPQLPFVEGRFSRQSSRTFKLHMHPCLSVGVAVDGEISYQVGKEHYLLQPGGLALINPETLHACNQQDAKPRSYGMLYLQTDWCAALQQSLWQVSAFVPVSTSLLEDRPLYAHYLRTLDILMAEDHLLEKEQRLIELMEAVFLRACVPAPPARPLPARIGQLKQLLAEDLAEDLSLARLSARLGLNGCTLIRQFKEATGMTPHAFRMNCRIHHARKLLQQGRDIGATALECGFFDQSHFHRHFKAMTTVTPREYQVNFMQ